MSTEARASLGLRVEPPLGMNDLDGRYGQNLISQLLFQFHVGVVSAGKRAICDRVHLLKLVKACNRSLMRAVFLGFTFNTYKACFQDSE